jgi:hypothetical protein
MSDWFSGSGSGVPVDGRALLSDATDAMGELVQLGALVSVGLTSDGGASGITVTLDGRWRREWFRETEPMFDWLAGAIEAVKASPREPDAPSAPRQRTRGRRGT